MAAMSAYAVHRLPRFQDPMAAYAESAPGGRTSRAISGTRWNASLPVVDWRTFRSSAVGFLSDFDLRMSDFSFMARPRITAASALACDIAQCACDRGATSCL